MEIWMKLLLLHEPIILYTHIVLAIVSIVLLYNVFFLVTHNKKKKRAPNASGGWPFIGHFHLFMSGKEILYQMLGTMADKYGPAFNIRLGNQNILVVSNSEMVRKWFTTPNHDKLFSNRTTSLAVKYIFNEETSIGFTSFGTYWREMRKVTVQQLLSKQCLESWRHLRIKEIDASFSILNELCSKDGTRTPTHINMSDWLADLTYNVFASVVFGYQSGVTGDTAFIWEKYKKTMVEAFVVLTSSFAVSDVFPCLEWVDRSRGLVRDLKRARDVLNSIAGCLIEEHRRKRSLATLSKHKGVSDDPKDFIDILLSLAEQSQLPGDNPDLVIKTMILETVSGGLDTTTITLAWTLSQLLNHPQVLKAARDEIDMHVGRDGDVQESDIPKLVYINAIIKETMRLCPTFPLIDRFTLEECEVGGFHVPAGGRLILNLWKIHRDPSVWDNPLEFKPERFLSNNDNKVDMDFKCQKYEFLPFGIGRRICPGMLSALRVMHLVVPRFIHRFDMKAVSANGKMNMAEKPGIICCQIAPLEVMVSLRP